jgi:outer membrane putative beta-barrel porin/alpha-amylase
VAAAAPAAEAPARLSWAACASRHSDNAGTFTLDLPESYLRYGLLEKTELRLSLPDYFLHLPVNDAATSGFADTAVGVKQQLGPLGGFNLAVIPFLSLPTGASRVSSHGYDPGLQLPWSRSLSSATTRASSHCSSTGN